MPTGYTANIAEGKPVTFEQFVWQCARAMGALCMMRDEPLDARVPVFEPTPYYRERCESKRTELEKARSKTDGELLDLLVLKYEEDRERDANYVRDRSAQAERYKAMIVKVAAWTPPSDDHLSFKEFMLSQLSESLSFDCSGIEDRRVERTKKPTLEDVAAMRQDWIARLEKDLERYTTRYQEEVDRTNASNRWVQQLRDSVGEQP